MNDKKTILFLLLALKTSMLCASPDTLDNYQFRLGTVSGETCEWLAGSNKNIRLTTHPLQDTQGFIVEVLPLAVDTGAKLRWSFGGMTPERCKDNVYSIEGNAFTLYYGETYALQTIQACVPPESAIHLSDAPALIAELPLIAGEKYYFCFYRQNARADYNYFMLEDLFTRTCKGVLHERVSLPYTSVQARLTRACKPALHERLSPPQMNGCAFNVNVKDFGATGDGETIDSDAINHAIETLAGQGGGTVYFPAGKYLSYSIRLKSHIRLLLDAGAELIAAFPSATEGYDAAEPNEHNRYQDFGHSHWKNSLLWAIDEEDITICGQGLINGRGLSREESRLTGVGNKAISLKACRNVVLRDIKMFRCGHFALLATGVENLTVDNLLIDTNRDGLDIDCCRNVRISNCTVNSPWDDAIVLKASYGLGRFKDTENVMITNCMVSGYDWGTVLDGTYRREQHQAPDQAFVTGRIKFGTESSGGFRNITISNCVFDRCRGLALETVDGGCLEDIVISNITMRDIVNAPIFLRLGARMRSPEGTPVGGMRRILIDNVNVVNADSRYASIISGIPGHCIEDVTLSNIRIRYKGGYGKDAAALTPPEHERRYPEPAMFGTIPASAFFVRHARNIRFHHIDVDFVADDFRPAFVLDDATDISIGETAVALPAGVAITELRNLSTLKETQSNIKE